ncbi:hypothetical protein D3C86_1680080 [compost metagenome]
MVILEGVEIAVTIDFRLLAHGACQEGLAECIAVAGGKIARDRPEVLDENSVTTRQISAKNCIADIDQLVQVCRPGASCNERHNPGLRTVEFAVLLDYLSDATDGHATCIRDGWQLICHGRHLSFEIRIS